MATITGGITGRPRGSIAGIVFGAARGRRGKLVTAREKVIPANPNTPAQQTQRSKFRDCLFIVREIGPSIYQDDWNRAVNQLPGFQSLMSIMLGNMDGNGLLTEPSDVPLGDLHFPDTFDYSQSVTTKKVQADWSAELGGNGTVGDELIMIAIEAARPVGRNRDIATIVADATRQEIQGEILCGQAAASYIILGYFSGVAAADGLLTLARAGTALSGA